MSEVKITRKQLDDINKALYFHGNAENLITAHKAMKLCGRQWMKYPALNDLTVTDLYAVLNYGYEIEPEVYNYSGRTKLAPEIIKAIEILSYELDFSVEDILKDHKEYPNGWRGRVSVLNGFDYQTLEKALTKGYIKGDGFIPTSQKDVPNGLETSDNTQLEREDYMSLIDIALDNGDKEWFRELSEKIREGWTQE